MNDHRKPKRGHGSPIQQALVAVTLALGVLSAQAQPFGDRDSIRYSEALWNVLEDARLVGDDAIGSVPYKGQHPHGAVIETLYDDVNVRGDNGEVIVKRNYGGEGITNAAVARDRDRYLKSITVMYKRESGYDPDNNNWFWVKYKPDGSLHTNPKNMKLAGRVAKGMPQGCIACHKAQRASDYQFNTTSFIND